MKTVEFYEVWDDFSEDGRGTVLTNKTLALFSKKADADIFACGNGNYGQKAQVKHRKIFICESQQDVKESKKQELIQAALNKLTPEEIKLLGIV